ncbi:aspartate aminotransferase family protein [Plectonema cf. radiosum LEGE 06105]|uniref:Aspartate aminotransferase family protein n=1 Tax=Plectonema cf. radiosum LEGE 06105 TaxID=945769 RepID=A0A8J7K4V5_9CYAN|nr:aspartate aminotransferase family protein [Plectonema radiosum]MBE9216532.1 aspartate aminotransferase family protein [Plectonema cf. radiosum LEGE 06105]
MTITKDKTNLQTQHLENLIASYTKRTQASKRYAQTYRPVLADKSSLGLGFSPEIKEVCYPVVVEKAAGSKLWDIDGNEYTDILMGLGINLLGHNPEFVKKAIATQLDKGFSMGYQAELAGEVAQLICELTKTERATFSNTGTEAIMSAIRMARTVTNRNKIAIFTNSYHGHSDNTLIRATFAQYAKQAASRKLEGKIANGGLISGLLRPIQSGLKNSVSPKGVPAAPGIPKDVAKNVLVLDYGNPQSLKVIEANKNQLAAVLVEPVQSRCPQLQPREFLQQLRSVTSKAGIALIFDEMVTGFRIHQGGSQAWFGVDADIVTYSKIVGGGLPMSVIAGKAAYMDSIDGGTWNYGDDSAPQTKTTFFAGTFCKHPLALAASKAVLEHLKAEGVELQKKLNQRTSELVEQLNNYFAKEGIPLTYTHFGSFFAADNSQSNISPMATNLMSFHLLMKGIHLRQGDKGGFLSTAHTEQDINNIIQAFKDSAKELQSAGYV